MKKVYIILLSVVMIFAVTSCGQTTDNTTVLNTTTEGVTDMTTTTNYISVYELNHMTADDIDITKQYFEHYIRFAEEDVFIMSSLTISGLDYQTGTYSQDGNTINATIGLKNYTFTLNETNHTITYEGTRNRQDIVATYVLNDQYETLTTTGDVYFDEELFGEDKSLYNFYNYCPSIMLMDNELYIWYCSNEHSNYIVDHIAFRKGTLNSDGLWSFTEKQLVLSPSEGAWDQVHDCDPTVIKGEFNYQGEDYNFLMAFLGCVTMDNSNNEVGIAVAKNPEGPWIKIEEHNPIANYYESDEYTNEVWTWGFGQPSLVSVDKSGKVLLFYTRGLSTGTSTYVEYWDFSNLDHPVLLNENVLSTSGIRNINGGNDIIGNADFAYDPVRNRIYTVRDTVPRQPEDPNFISDNVPISFTNLAEEDTFVGETLFSDDYAWLNHDFITSDISGFARNHNPGLITDEYGWLISPNEIPVIYTVSILNTEGGSRTGWWKSLHSYRLYGYMSIIVE
ncbi:hypothetical protein ACAG96_00310 [Candidatus Izemoplasma sp. B36]|uniref:hypothetical protein n=1 Tax=Candidatus Izemoplasma sp. B36 TaxID=3242468 RepID=UPI003558781C